MIILKFEKTSTSALAGHVDTLRAVTYLFRRANFAVDYSLGFNPHMELGFSSPIALGVESLCEYVSAKSSDSTDGLLEKLNATCPQGIKFTKVFLTQQPVNVASKFNRAKYVVKAEGIGNVVHQILQPNYTISYLEKGSVVNKDVSAKIVSACKIDDNTAEMVLLVGNDNLRPDRVVLHLMDVNGITSDYSIVKTQMFVDDVLADDYLQQQCLPQD